MQGGAGDDVYVVDDAGDLVIELAGEGNDTVRYTHNVALANATLAQATAIDTPPAYTLPDNIEYLILEGNGDFNASGNAGNNTLTGNSGANQLGGGAGNDTLKGGAGSDVYVFNRGDGQDAINNTDFLKDNTLDKTKDWLLANLPAGGGAVTAPQVVDAARFYLDILKTNPTASISFTGHSLGGGLASLMAVYFDRSATVFDEAPFEKSADSLLVVEQLKATLRLAGYALPTAFANYVALDLLTGAIIPSPTNSPPATASIPSSTATARASSSSAM